MGDLLLQAERFYGHTANRGHASPTTLTQPMEDIRQGLESGQRTARRSLDMVEGTDLKVLEVGCSFGPLVFGAACSERVAEAVGVDVAQVAVELAEAIRQSDLVEKTAAAKARFVQAPAENLPFPEEYFDLITCHTVIEHVFDVEKALVEMYRVLKPGGALHLEAPNYLWPCEPHLGIWMPPLGPKWLVKLLATLHPRKDQTFVDHLQFIHPRRVERIFKVHGMIYQNIYLDKLADILLHADYARVVGMRRAIPVLRALRALRCSRIVFAVAKGMAFYPSLEYRISKGPAEAPHRIAER